MMPSDFGFESSNQGMQDGEVKKEKKFFLNSLLKKKLQETQGILKHEGEEGDGPT